MESIALAIRVRDELDRIKQQIIYDVEPEDVLQTLADEIERLNQIINLLREAGTKT